MSDLTDNPHLKKNSIGLYSHCAKQTLSNQHMPILFKKLKEPKVILDIGANDGTHTILYLRAFAGARVYSFEPDPRAVMQFRKNLEGFSDWELYEGALSNEVGCVDLNMAWMGQNHWSLSSSIVPSVDGHYGLAFKEKHTVACTTLDAWVAEKGITCIDFAHTDLQGAERLFIEGASEAFKCMRFILMEYGEVNNYPDALDYETTCALMKTHGFEPIMHESNDLLFENTGFSA